MGSKLPSNYDRCVKRIDDIGNAHRAVVVFNEEMEKRRLDYRMNKSTTQKMLTGECSDALVALFLIATDSHAKK